MARADVRSDHFPFHVWLLSSLLTIFTNFRFNCIYSKVADTVNPNVRRLKEDIELEVSLGYKVISRPAWATVRDLDSKSKHKVFNV